MVGCTATIALRKLSHAIYRILFFSCKNWNFRQNNFGIFNISDQNIDRGYTEAVLTSQTSIVWSKNKRKKVYPCIPKFYYIKVGFKGVFIARTCFPDGS